MPYKLTNPTGNDVTGLYAGHPYTVPAKGSLELEDGACAVKLAHDLGPRGVVLEAQKHAKPGAEPPKPKAEPPKAEPKRKGKE